MHTFFFFFLVHVTWDFLSTGNSERPSGSHLWMKALHLELPSLKVCIHPWSEVQELFAELGASSLSKPLWSPRLVCVLSHRPSCPILCALPYSQGSDFA